MCLPILPIIPIPQPSKSSYPVSFCSAHGALTRSSHLPPPPADLFSFTKNLLQPPTRTRPLARSQSLALLWHLPLPAWFSSHLFHESRLPGDFGLSISLLPAEIVSTWCFTCKEEQVLLLHISSGVLPCSEVNLQEDLWAVGSYSVAELHRLPIPLSPDSRGICLSTIAACRNDQRELQVATNLHLFSDEA